MFKTQLRFQKIMTFAMLIVAALTFVYALGLMTDIYDMLYFTTREVDGEYFSSIEGGTIYYEMHPYNNLLLAFSIVLILALSLITSCHLLFCV